MSGEPIRYHREGAVGVLALNRPEKLNAMTEAMGDAIEALVRELNADTTLRVLVVRGEGRAFSAGGDLAFLEANAGRPQQENEDTMRSFYARFLSLMEVEVPTIAVLNGRATGAGLCLALGCDMRLAADDALLSLNFVRVGLSPGMAGTWNLPRLVGPAKAAELLFTGRTLKADEALAMGLVNAVHAEAQVFTAAMAMAEAIAEGAPGAMKATKRLLRGAEGRSLADGLTAEAASQAECFASSDLIEGVQAAREKRPPRFTGH